MSRKVYIFNPENDLALANGNENFEPPLAARILRSDLSLLPLWYADENAVVLTYSEVPAEWLKKEREALGVHAFWSTVESFPQKYRLGDCFIPWGWSPAIRKLWRKATRSESLLHEPDLERCKKLSHKAFAIDVLNMLGQKSLLPDGFQLPQELFSPGEVETYSRENFPVLLKAPWSGSGRGLYWRNKSQDEKMKQWASPVLQKQGSIIGEPVYRKEADFAMQFFSNGREVVFSGYSLFVTDKYGAYKGNLLESDEVIREKLSQYIPVEKLKQVQEALTSFFSLKVAPFYKGYLGVDMMICLSSENPNIYFFHPCVEVNLRMNMGMTCRLFYDRYVSHNSHGIFQIDYCANPGVLYEEHLKQSAGNPLKIENGKIHSGYLSLSPVSPESRYHARVEIEIK